MKPDLTRQALALRSLGLHLLAAPPARLPATMLERAGAAPPDAWDLFLRAERFAAPLRRRLAGAGLEASLPAPARETLVRNATADVQRFLSAGAQVRSLAALAADRGWTLVLLKGGAAVAAGCEPLNLGDLDILVHAEDAVPVVRALESRGYLAGGADAAVGSRGVQHLGARSTPGAIGVEVHFSVHALEPVREAIERAVPAGVSGAYRLAPADELWHLLCHSTLQHLERRGQLREVLLLAGALQRAAPHERAAVEARAARHPHAAVLGRALEMAAAAAHGRPPPDRFPEMAAGRCLWHAALDRASLANPRSRRDILDLWRRLPAARAALNGAFFASLGSRRDVLDLWRRFPAAGSLPSVLPAVASLERRLPRVGGAARMVLRTLNLGLASALTIGTAARARRLARNAALRPPDGGGAS